VLEITPGSPADEAGLIGSDRQGQLDGQGVRVGGDVITAVDGQPVEDFEDLITFLARYANVDQTITLTILRDDQPVEVPLTLAARPGRSSATETPREIRGQAWLGISGANLTPSAAEAMDLDVDTQGVIVQQVTAGSPADEAGIRGSFKPLTVDGVEIFIGGDVISIVDKTPITSISELSRLIGKYESGDKITLSVLREGKQIEIPVQLGELPQ
jgi:S1-C subfamily serine protease